MRKGRPFETLIQKIKELKLPNAVVASPEFVPDTQIGIPREVDVGIRYKIDDEKDIFIAVECRDRGKMQDIQWIEHLITKKISIGADVMIAVSSSSFSKNAKLKAVMNGIQIRGVEQFQPEEILSWADATYVEIYHIGLKFLEANVVLRSGGRLRRPLSSNMCYFRGNFANLHKIIDQFIPPILGSLDTKLRKHGDIIEGKMFVKDAKDIAIIWPYKDQIQDLWLDTVAISSVDRFPILGGYRYKDDTSEEMLAEGFEYAAAGHKAFQLTVDSKTKAAFWEIDWSALPLNKDLVTDVILAIMLKCRDPAAMKTVTIKRGKETGIQHHFEVGQGYSWFRVKCHY